MGVLFTLFCNDVFLKKVVLLIPTADLGGNHFLEGIPHRKMMENGPKMVPFYCIGLILMNFIKEHGPKMVPVHWLNLLL